MIQTVIFDLGNVLVDWSVEHFLLAKGYSAEQTAALLEGPLSLKWHSIADAGVPLQENARRRAEECPADAEAIGLYAKDWQQTIIGPIDESVALLERLSATSVDVFAITNFPADEYDAFVGRFDFMQRFQSVLVSGDVGLKKPDPRIFALALDKFGCDPATSLFIDDRRENCRAAAAFGLHTHVFQGPGCLAKDLEKRGLI